MANERRREGEPAVGYLSNTPVELLVRPQPERTGAKTPASIDMRIGGPAANGAPAVRANGLSAVVLGAQVGAALSRWVNDALLSLGFEPWILEGRVPALSVGMQKPSGGYDLFVQRTSVIRPAEIPSRIRLQMERLPLVIVGPISGESKECAELLRWASKLGRHRALVPHPSLLVRAKAFLRLTHSFGYVQLNRAEFELLAGRSAEKASIDRFLDKHSGPETEWAVTCGSHPGFLWSGGRIYTFIPRGRPESCDVGAGDLWCAAYQIARRIRGLSSEAAAEYAVEAVSAHLSGDDVAACSGPWMPGKLKRGRA